MAFTFTDQQRMALEFPGNVIVSAGAGSGKTRVLVEKYFRLLVDQHPKWPVDSVVAITFTRKAAAELKSRIISRVLMELETEPDGTARRVRLQELRAEVGAAPIGTIHTFCGRLLREFAFEAHLDPDYAVIEGAQEGALRLAAARDAIAEATAAKGTDLYVDLLSLLNVFSASKLNEILAGMLAGRTNYIVPANRYLAHSMDELFMELKGFHKEYADCLRLEIGREWKNLMDQLSASALPGKVKDIATSAAAHWPSNWVEHWESCTQILEGVLAELFTKNGTCRKREFKQAGFDDADSLCLLLNDLWKKHNSARLDNLDDTDRADIEMTRQLARIFLRAAELYEQLRGGEGQQGETQLMDFSDLEIFAARLMGSSPELRQEVRKRYPYLIIDEFQDTSQAQWDILRPIVTNEDGQLQPASLFVVGDRKQGVYGFRDANVALFSEVQSLVEQSNPEWHNCRGSVTMAANFRTNPTPLAFINNVFQTLLSEASSVYSVLFEPLTAMRTEKDGCVEFLVSCPHGESDEDNREAAKMKAAEHRACEAALVAAHVKSLIDSGEAKAGDIALLFRKRSVFADYEAALKAQGVPCVPQHGDNLFHQPELADLVSALNSVVYPHQDLEFVHYLRSPFIGCRDDLLLKVARTHGRSFYDKTITVVTKGKYQLDCNWHTVSELEKDRLSFSLSVLQRARSLVGTVPPFEIVNFIVNELEALQSVHAGYRGTQAAANVEKLLLMARSAEALSFEDFLEFIRSEEQSLKGTAEAANLATPDAVKIMTVHAAKGLEFPVVYLPDLNTGTSGRGHDVYGDGTDWMTLLPPLDYVSRRSFLAEYFKMVSQKQQEAEERRVFYVAMTRCESRLILSASPDAKARAETFYDWIASDFEKGKREGLLKTQADLAETLVADYGKAHPVAGRARGTRETRFAAALSATDFFAASTPSSSAERNLIESHPLQDLLPQFLHTAYYMGPDVATAMIASLLPEKKHHEWSKFLAYLAQWVREEFPAGQHIAFGSRLRFVVNGTTRIFKPHILAPDRCGWIVLAGSPAEHWKAIAAQYNAASAEVPGAPPAEVWLLSDEPQPVSL